MYDELFMTKSDLPFGSEFSPNQIDLIVLLAFAKEHNGNWRKLEKAIKEKYFLYYETTESNRKKLANNCKLGMIAYGFIDRDGSLTDFGNQMIGLRGDVQSLYSTLARHILLHLHGYIFIQTIQDMHRHGERIDLQSLRKWLGERGIHFPRGGKHASIMRLWLEKAGVFKKNSWRINEKTLESLTGVGVHSLEAFSSLSHGQILYLRTLANMSGTGPFFSNEIEKLASAIYGIKYDEKNLPKTILYPLQRAGFIDLKRGTKSIGRGAKPFLVTLTQQMQTHVIEPLSIQFERNAQPSLRPLLRKSLKEILQDIRSTDKNLKGLALEALGFHLMRLIDLTYIATRVRGISTAGAEVDLIFEGTRLLFTRWQIQCKNTQTVSLDDVAKEVGLTIKLKSNVVMVISTGTISKDAREYAHQVMSLTNLNVILLDTDDLESLVQNPVLIAEILQREAIHAMEIKKLNL